MDLNTFLAVGIIGIGLSLVIEAIQRKFGIGSAKTRALAIVLAIVVGSGYYFLSRSSWWGDVIGVLSGASTVYAMFFSGSKPSPQPEG